MFRHVNVKSAVFLTALTVIMNGLAGLAGAAEVRGLFEAEVPIADKTEAARETGLGDALAQVITKVTGVRNPTANPVVADAIASPGRFVQQFRYRLDDAAVTESLPATQRWLLWARFDSGVVEGLVQDAGMRIWGRLRPDVMLWVAVEQDGVRRILGGEDSLELAAVMRAAARHRGLPVLLPLLDIEDQTRLRISDVWGGFRERILLASSRYHANVILSARVYRLLPTLWEGQFTLIIGDQVQEWSGQGDILELLLSDLVHEVADRLASRFAGPGSLAGSSGLSMVVNGIRSVSDYARTLKYLAALEQISDVDVTRVLGDEVSFQVQARGSRESLLSVIRVGNTLEPEGFPEDVELRFRLIP